MKKYIYVLIIGFFVQQTNAQSLTLDSSFGTDGIALGEENYGWERILQIVQPDGKIIISGHKFREGVTPATCINLCLYNQISRFNADGSIDTAFGNNGTFIYDNDDYDDNGPDKIELLPDGGILVGREYGSSSSGNTIEVSKLTSAGVLDTSFGNNGYIVTAGNFLTENHYPFVVDLDNAVFYLIEESPEIRILKYDFSGSLDSSFGTNGSLTLGLTNENEFSSFELLPDNHLLLFFVDFNTQSLEIQKMDLNGNLDSSFGTITVASNNFEDDEYFFLSKENKFLISYLTESVTTLKQYNLDGSTDTSFGTNGVVTMPENYFFIPYLSDNNQVYLCGAQFNTTDESLNLAIAKITADGSLDSNFANNGIYDSDNELLGIIEYAAVNEDYIITSISNVKIPESDTNRGLEQQVVAKFNFENLNTTEFDQQNQLKINTFITDELLVQSNQTIKFIHVYNANGQLIFTLESSSNNTYNLSSLQTGIYVVNFELENGNLVSRKIIKR